MNRSRSQCRQKEDRLRVAVAEKSRCTYLSKIVDQIGVLFFWMKLCQKKIEHVQFNLGLIEISWRKINLNYTYWFPSPNWETNIIAINFVTHNYFTVCCL